MLRRLAALALAACTSLASPPAEAFCGFYVGGADTKLFNHATQVALLRDGPRTVLSMQNDYQGPPASFALVVPVPVILRKDNVKTLPRDVFARLDQLTAPRLVEYWEQDPCPEAGADIARASRAVESRKYDMAAAPAAMATTGHVRVEAEFAVGEYEIVILSADDSLGLETWLRENKYNIPSGAAPVLAPYVASGMKFFVARVNIDRVTMTDGRAVLSPLRFHYDDDRFALPVRLGLLNSDGVQDLIVHVLSREGRYEVANYDNVTIPTNLELSEQGKDQFGAFYAALFDRTTERHPRAVVTEYAWNSGSCDPCPGPTLSGGDLALLGGDVATQRGPAPGASATGSAPTAKTGVSPPLPSPTTAGAASPPPSPGLAAAPSQLSPWQVTVSRLHARYRRETLGEDLVFRKAAPLRGGNENWGGANSQDAIKQPENSQNMFQGRYILRHPWAGAITCAEPRRGVWGGPPDGAPLVQAARDLGHAPRGEPSFARWLTADVPSLDLRGTPAPVLNPSPPAWTRLRDARLTFAAGLALGLAAVAAVALRSRRPS